MIAFENDMSFYVSIFTVQNVFFKTKVNSKRNSKSE